MVRNFSNAQLKNEEIVTAESVFGGMADFKVLAAVDLPSSSSELSEPKTPDASNILCKRNLPVSKNKKAKKKKDDFMRNAKDLMEKALGKQEDVIDDDCTSIGIQFFNSKNSFRRYRRQTAA